MADAATTVKEMFSTAILKEAEVRRTLASRLVSLTFFALDSPGRSHEFDDLHSEVVNDFVHPPELRA